MMQITEDTPPDMLAGAMDLTVHLPNGTSVKMSVERSTPMMDLLVQITTANHLQLSNYTLQVLGMMPSSSEHSNKVLPFKPNTPIGTLDTQHIKVLPKSRTLPASKYIAPGHQPFESTFRLKVYLPRNQLYVTRVSRNVQLEEIMKKVCEEKNLDPLKYDFKHPANLDEVLNPKLTLNDYQITEIYVVAKGTNNLSQTFSSADIMALRKEEERKQMHSKTGGGVLNLIFKRGKSSMGSGSVSSENRSISPTHSDDSRSVTPPAAHDRPIVTPPLKNQPPDKPRAPQRKRRPAPKPPQTQRTSASSVVSGEVSTEAAAATINNNNNKRATENGLTICHSRNSSDSSGYHEASILSDHCANNNNTSLPRTRPKSAFVGDVPTPQSSSNLSKMAAHSVSTTSLVSGRKKKPAPPPPPITVSPPSSIVAPSLKPPETPSPLVASQTENIATPPELITSTNLTSTPDTTTILPPSDTSTPERLQAEEKSFESTDSGIAQDNQSDQDNKELNEEEFQFHTPPLLPPPIADDLLENKIEEEPLEVPVVSKKESEREEELTDVDWQYQLPSPPKAFRDSSPTSFVQNETNSHTSDFKDSVVTSPELFEKLRTLEDSQSEKDTVKSEVTSIASEEPLNTLSLEHLEKRKSLVYNRELTTSLKMTDSIESSIKTTSTTTLTNASTENFSSTIQPTKPSRNVGQHHTLPNFKITTYDVPKHKNIKVFEDDTIRSNTQPKPLTRSQWGHSMENISFSSPRRSFAEYSDIKDKEYKFYRPQSNLLLPSSSSMVSRSGSFSTEARSPSKPSVSRSKSTLVLNKYQSAMRRDDPGMSRSNSLFDVSGLQSLEVMKLIRDKLSTPTGSVENLNKPVENVQSVEQKPAQKIIVQEQQRPATVAAESKPELPTKKYYYRGPPAVNMSTWSERPKIPVAVKEDEDYKLGNVSSKLIVNTTNNNLTSNNSVEVKGAGEDSRQNVTLNINNETEQITQKSGNVIIKIGSGARTGTMRPVYTNSQRQQQPRPHSIALFSDFDGSRVPVVRSVELKKPYKETPYGYNTSVTHLNQGNEELFVDKFKRNSYSNEDYGTKTFRVSSFKPLATPTVRGFRAPAEDSVNNNNNNNNNRMSWQQHEKDYGTNQHVPFSRSTLKRTESSKLYNNKVEETSAPIARSPTIVTHQPQQRHKQKFAENETFTEYHSLPTTLISKSRQNKAALSTPAPPPPPPPQMPKVTLRKVPAKETSGSSVDPRDQLLEAIRNFGGKKGLRAVNA